jgi:hypothetical protein
VLQVAATGIEGEEEEEDEEEGVGVGRKNIL